MTSTAIEQPVVAVDVVVFTVVSSGLAVLLHRRPAAPFQGAPALPGVAVRVDETLLDAARRALRTKTGCPASAANLSHLEQLATFDALYRDVRGRTISVAHLGIARAPGWTPSAAAMWRPATPLAGDHLPFDHGQIIAAAVTRLQGKLRYTNIAGRFLDRTFRIEALQEVYEAVLQRPLNRTNFRSKLLKIGLIERVKVLAEAVGKKGGRPPHLYRFCRDDLEITERDFL
jgi:8-oxo-dGTP diphosphatase